MTVDTVAINVEQDKKWKIKSYIILIGIEDTSFRLYIPTSHVCLKISIARANFSIYVLLHYNLVVSISRGIVEKVRHERAASFNGGLFHVQAQVVAGNELKYHKRSIVPLT